MRLPKAGEHGSSSFVDAGRKGTKGRADDERHFQALFEESVNPSDALLVASTLARDDPREIATRPQSQRAARDASCRPPEREQKMYAFGASASLDIDRLKVRLRNGPLAGSEIEAYRQGQHLSIHVRACLASPGQADRPSPKALAQMLSMRSGLNVSVEMDGARECSNAPAAAP